MKEKLLKKLPKKYHERVNDFYIESGLIDECKYMLSFSNGFNWDGYESIPCKTVTEAIDFVKNSKHIQIKE